MNLNGRRILVTGAGAGIGAAIAEACSMEGADVAVNDVDPERAATSAERLSAVAVPGDVADSEDGRRVVAEAKEALGGLDGLVNNAGIVIPGALADIDDTEWDRVMHVNLRSAFVMSRAFAEVADTPAAIVNLASIAATHPTPGVHAYSASKAAVVSLTQQIALEWGPSGIRANAIAPGMISGTNMSAAESDDLRERRGAILPLRRTGRPDDIADVAAFLLSDGSRYITGQTIHVDGGWSVSLLSFTPRPWE